MGFKSGSMVEYGHNVALELCGRHAVELLLPGDGLRNKNLRILSAELVAMGLRGVLLVRLATLDLGFVVFLVFDEGGLVAGDLGVFESGEDAVAE
jgi:hypothetical protein